MPGKVDRLIQRMAQTKRGFSDEDLRTILVGRNFRVREGKHSVYEHPDHPDLTAIIPRTVSDLHPKYVKWVASLLEELDRRQEAAK